MRDETVERTLYGLAVWRREEMRWEPIDAIWERTRAFTETDMNRFQK